MQTTNKYLTEPNKAKTLLKLTKEVSKDKELQNKVYLVNVDTKSEKIKFMVSGRTEMYEVKLQQNNLWTCNCRNKRYRTNLCEHIMACIMHLQKMEYCKHHQEVVELLEDCIAEFQLAEDLGIICMEHLTL